MSYGAGAFPGKGRLRSQGSLSSVRCMVDLSRKILSIVLVFALVASVLHGAASWAHDAAPRDLISDHTHGEPHDPDDADGLTGHSHQWGVHAPVLTPAPYTLCPSSPAAVAEAVSGFAIVEGPPGRIAHPPKS
jgi:hypothetical protein